MSHEIQLSNSNPPLQPMLTPPQLLPTTTGQSEQTPLRRAHRLLRGRYALAVVLAAMGAAAGATAGIMLPKPSWKSTGYVRISPTIPNGDKIDVTLPMYQQYVADIALRMHTDRVIKLAMMNPEWRKHRPFAGDVPPNDQVVDFSKNLTVKQMPLVPSDIDVTYEDSRPDAKEVVQVAVSSLISAFHEVLNTSDVDNELTRLAQTKKTIEDKQKAIDDNRRVISDLQQRVGDGNKFALDEQHRQLIAKQSELAEWQRRLEVSELDRQRRQPGAHVSTTAPASGTGNFTPEEIEGVSQKMVLLLQNVNSARLQVEAYRLQGLMANSKSMQVAQEALSAAPAGSALSITPMSGTRTTSSKPPLTAHPTPFEKIQPLCRKTSIA